MLPLRYLASYLRKNMQLLVFMQLLYVYVAGPFSVKTVTVSAQNVNGSVRVTWNTTLPPECMTSVTVDFRTNDGSVATYTTTNILQTDFIQTGLQCGTYYYIAGNVTGETSNSVSVTVRSREVQVWLTGGKLPIARVHGDAIALWLHTIVQIYLNHLE